MINSRFVGRQQEMELLREANWRGQAPLIVIYGRRRVGKTALIEKTFENEILWKFEGLENATVKSQMVAFLEQLSIYSGRDKSGFGNVKNWRDAFVLLDQCLKGKNIIVFFDEFQWLAGMKSGFVSLFKYFWDNHFQKHKKCRFIICGSVSSFIVRKVLQSKALYGRVSVEINLLPLSFKEASLFFPDKSHEERLEIYMTFGGVPKYLKELNPQYSYLQNLNEYAFRQDGFFLREFHRLFISHFSHTPHYEKILAALSGAKKDITQLARICGTQKGGSFSQVLDDLGMAGFIEKQTPLDKSQKSKIIRYGLKDPYLDFYFTFIAKNVPSIQTGQFRFHQVAAKKMEQWHGYAFERFCCQHSRDIASYLKFSGIQYQAGPWFRNGSKGAQVDLMFIRKDRMITLCEIKYADQLSSRLMEEFENKIRVIKEQFPLYGIQKVLVVGKSPTISKTVRQYFHDILPAGQVF